MANLQIPWERGNGIATYRHAANACECHSAASDAAVVVVEKLAFVSIELSHDTNAQVVQGELAVQERDEHHRISQVLVDSPPQQLARRC